MARRFVEERNIETLEDLISVYNEVKTKMGYFIMMGIPIPDDQRINFRTMLWVSSVVQQPNVIIEYNISRFCTESYHKYINTFLDKFTFATHLFLMDADEIPVRTDVLQLMVAANEDIVVGPTPIVKSNKGICWNIDRYVNHPEPHDINFLRWKDLPKEKFRINYSGGPWLIKRKVLETLKWPYFKDVFDKNRRIIGQDVYFDMSAAEAGFELWCEPEAKFEHCRPTNLNIAMNEYFRPDTGGIGYGGFSITALDWDFIKDVMLKNNVKNVLEFGSGLSSLFISEHAKIDSFETDPKQAEFIKQRCRNENLIIHLWDGISCELPQQNYDLVFVDGPKGKSSVGLTGGIGREHSIRIASEHSDRIIIHDANREEEIKLQDKYIKPYFNLVAQSSMCNYWERRDK